MYSRETLALMEAAVDAIIVIDHQGRMLAVNEATRRAFGYRTDELLGENVSMLMPAPDRDRHDQYIARYLETGNARIIGIGREVIAQRKNGSVFPVRLSVGRVPGCEPARFVGLIRDVTSEHEAMADLKLERDRANAYLELNDAILLKLDPETRICEINGRGSELLGAPREEIRGRDWLDFIRGEGERERARFMLSGATGNGSSRERELDSVDFSGERLRIYWRCIALRTADGSPAGWLVSGSDVTERQRREEDAVLAQDRITRVARLATMGEMAAGVAHELNQPLTAITTYARACERYLDMTEPDLQAAREAVREIGEEGLRAGSIIQRLRHLVRHDICDRVTANLNELVAELSVLFNADAREHETELEICMGGDLPKVEVDAVQIQQVILNLVRNAFESVVAEPRGSRRIQIATTRTEEGDVELRVTDNGPGVSTQIAESLFEPFSTTKPNGSGLGLTISRTIVRSHGGTIGLLPLASRGACFYLRLPAEQGARAWSTRIPS
jgi:two-component system, LuxR family, sensor kinase FixL